MAIITIRHILRRTGRVNERHEIAGEITLPPGRSVYQSGSFQLRKLEAIQLTPVYNAAGVVGSRLGPRNVFGSIASVNNVGNTVLLIPVFAGGSIGTRTADQVRKIGSVVGVGTTAAYFIAHGI